MPRSDARCTSCVTTRRTFSSLAWPLLGSAAESLLELSTAIREDGFRADRANWLLRGIVTEQRLVAAIDRGVRQYVILGAGLDTFAWRHEPLAVQCLLIAAV